MPMTKPANSPGLITPALRGIPISGLMSVYDLAGRLRSVTGQSLSASLPAPQTATFNQRQQLTSLNGRLFIYDTAGRLLSDELHAYIWNDRNHLLQSVRADDISSYKYDALGRRIQKIEAGKNASYIYDMMNILRATVDGTSFDYLRGLGLDEIWASRSELVQKTYLTDRLGSIIGTVSAQGLEQTANYDEYGGLGAFNRGNIPNFGFTGREHDLGTLIYFRARFYDAESGRFLTPDPLYSSFEANGYIYAQNDPVNKTDRLGLQAGLAIEISNTDGISCTTDDECREAFKDYPPPNVQSSSDLNAKLRKCQAASLNLPLIEYAFVVLSWLARDAPLRPRLDFSTGRQALGLARVAKMKRLLVIFGALLISNPSKAQETRSFIYDNAGQLIAVAVSDGSAIIYQYDNAGNRVSLRVRQGNSESVSAIVPEAATAGTTMTEAVLGKGLASATGITFSNAGITALILAPVYAG